MSAFNSGREAALARRRALSAGKAALPPPSERTRTGLREAGPASAPPQPPPALPVVASAAVAAPLNQLSGRLASIARRRSLAAGKAGAAHVEAAAPPASPGPGERRSRLTASRVAEGHQVTGTARDVALSVSGTQHISAAAGASFGEIAKVGQVRTEGGRIVSGTLVRSAVPITGDERGASRITGEADPSPADDLTPRADYARAGLGANPKAGAAFAGRAGRGSRQRDVTRTPDTTVAGSVITGSDAGRSLSVTGDEAGGCVSGSGYLVAAGRPAGGAVAKVATSATWGGRRVTGIDVAAKTDVTGDPPAGADLLTGSQYDLPKGARSAAARRMQAHARLPVTGDAPVVSAGVSGLERGSDRSITGTAYVPTEPAGEPAAAGGFSLPTPPRAPRRDPADPQRITGAFAVGGDKVTGNVEFRPPTRSPREGKPAHARLTGEGRADSRITGDSWAQNGRVTGTESSFAAERNPSERGEKAKAFAGSAQFKSKARHEEAKQLVTGMVGYFNKAGARVTLSGGAQS